MKTVDVRTLWLVALMLAGSLVPVARSQTAEPARLIEKMSAALKTLNYEGTFIHLQGGSVESLYILHSSDDRGELERMVSLNGEAREVIRNHDRVTCIWPANSTVMLSHRIPRNALPDVDAALADNSRYKLQLGRPDRVAGIATQVVHVLPRDELRYGYRFWIDESTSMLLRFMVLDSQDRTLEEVMFTAIEYPEDVNPARFEVDVNEGQAIWVQPETSTVAPDVAVVGERKLPLDPAMRVSFADLPAGYAEVSQTYRSMPINDDDRPISHAMLSDGLASVSVYVEHVKHSGQDKSTLGLSSMGGMNAYGLSLPDALITVVGEVPVQTVERIARAVKLP